MGFSPLVALSHCCIRMVEKTFCISNTSSDIGYCMFVTVVERVVCLGHFFRLQTKDGTLQRPDGKICQATRAEILLLWLMTFCRIHAEKMKGNPALPSSRTSPFFFLLSCLFLSSLDKAYKLQCTQTKSLTVLHRHPLEHK